MSAVAPLGRSGNSPAGGRQPALDGVRGLAIVCVMLVHFNQWHPVLPVERVASDVMGSLWGGVELFFVLSGFLITGILFDAKGSSRYFSDFYARRALRIFPLYYATLVVLLIGPRLLAHHPHWHQTLSRHQGWLWGYATNVLVARYGWNAVPLTSHFWTLAIEEQFYLLWPLVVFRYRRETLLRICGWGIGFALLFRVFWLAIPTGWFDGALLLPGSFDTLLVGAALALVARGPEGVAPLARYAPAVGLICFAAWLGIVIGLPRQRLSDPGAVTMLHLSYAGLSFAIIATLTESSARGRVHRIFMARPLRALGLYSYALYVFHFPIAILIQKKLFSELPRTTGSALMPELRYIVVAGGMSFAAAWLSWHLFEKHFLKLKDRFRHPRVQAEQQGASALTTAAPTARSAAAADGPSAPHSSNT